MILIAGDSWGCGEWSAGFPPGLPSCWAAEIYDVVPKVPFRLTHRGLQQFFEDDGMPVTNVCQAGGSNSMTVEALTQYFNTAGAARPHRVLVFQTEYDRDLMTENGTLDLGFSERNIITLGQRMIKDFYRDLAGLCQRFSISIDIIGGCTDALEPQQVSDQFPGCRVICQSMTNLLLWDDHRTERPVLSWYKNRLSRELSRHMKSRCNTDQDLGDLVEDLQQGMDREITLFQHPEWFYPNDVHPNRYAHHKLYRSITKGL